MTWGEIVNLLWPYLFRVGIICLGTLGSVYFGGRLLSILESDKAKNRFAAFMLVFLSYGYMAIWYPRDKLAEAIWDVGIYALISAIPYIIFCWRLFDRMDSLLDRKGLKDKKRYKRS